MSPDDDQVLAAAAGELVIRPLPLRDFVTHHATHIHHRDIGDVRPAVATALG